MKKRCLFMTLALGLGLTLALLWVLGARSSSAVAAPSVGNEASNAPAAELHVCPNGCAYSSVQAAVDDANEGDVVKVAAGTYTGVSARGSVIQVLYIDKAITVYGGYTVTNWITPNLESNLTTLNAEGKGRALYITGAAAPTVDGLRLTGGDAEGLGGHPEGFPGQDDAGGGVYINQSPATLRNCQVFSNTASSGGGLFLNDSTATLSDNTIFHNTTSDLTPNNFAGGVFLYGGGATLNQNTIISNTAGSGGGLQLTWGGGALDSNIVRFNTARWDGGGLRLRNSSATLTNNVVTDNHAVTNGGGLSILASTPLLKHATIARNTADEDGSGIFVSNIPFQSNVSIVNSILSSHQVGINVATSSEVNINTILLYDNTTDWMGEGVVTGTHYYTGTPAFASDGYHITACSMAIDRVSSTDVATDIDGDSRPMGGDADIGADEIAAGAVCRRVYLPLVVRSYATP